MNPQLATASMKDNTNEKLDPGNEVNILSTHMIGIIYEC